MATQPIVVVTVGTDHHPFGRLIRWMDEWSQANPDVRCVVQHGMSPPPMHAEAVSMVTPAEMLALLSEATVVVCQAGPGSILDARRAGLVPIVVPRLRALGEVVDDHQVGFAKAMASRGDAIVAGSQGEVVAQVQAAVLDPDSVRRAPAPSPAGQTGGNVTRLLNDVASRPPGLINLRRVRDLLQARRLG